jgi:hypothetical protein
MPVLLVIYDCPKGDPNQDLMNTIWSYQHAQLGRDSYAIETDESPDSLYQRLLPYLENDHMLFVDQMTPSFTGKLKINISNFLNVAMEGFQQSDL